MDLQGRSILITGASSGIGAGLAREFSRRGADVALCARRKESLDSLARELSGTGQKAIAIRTDVTRDGDLEAAIAETVKAFGRLDIVVANAGFSVTDPFTRLGLEDYRKQFETNVFGVLRTAYASLEELKKSRGSLVLMGSVMSYFSLPACSPYSMSKYSVRALAETLAYDLKPKGISVTLVCPGFVKSEIRQIDNQGQFNASLHDPVPDWIQMPTEVAAHQIVNAVAKRRREAVITGHGKILVFMKRHFPRLSHWMIGRVTAKLIQG